MKRMLFLLSLVIILIGCTSTKETVLVDVEPAQVKYCALTFDDGPDAVKTPRVLDKLEKYGVVATFFVIGQLIDETTAPVMRRALEQGCEFGNHSWAWDSMDNMTAEQVKESVDRTTAAIEKYTGVTPAFFRPPNLAKSDVMFEAVDMPFAEGVLGFDWDGTGTNAEERAQNVLNEIQDGAIILLHDVQPDPHPTPEALDILIPVLLEKGYVFVTLSELFAIKGVPLDPEDTTAWKYVQGIPKDN